VNTKFVGLGVGVAFGFILAWSRVTDPSVIRDMLLLREPDVFLLMGSAIVVAAVGIRIVRRFATQSLVSGEPIAWTSGRVERRHIVGSALFGAGWSVACTCPGPVAAMIGECKLAGLVVAAGLVVGVALKGLVDRQRDPALGAAQASAEGCM
jgi:uncharacterized membrane protein YedE/YeeE